ncbi:MAG: PQQ-binding-like beta-propeller repeat protein, partial [Planctomycetota bacterium]
RADSGELLWKKEFTRNEQLLPLTLTVAGPNVFYQSTLNVARLDARSGKEIWHVARQTAAKRMSFSAPTVVAATDVLLVADRTPTGKDAPSAGTLAWAVHGWDEPGFGRKSKCTLQAYAIESGKVLWSAECSEGYNSPVDLFVVGDTAWVGGDFTGYELKTGALKKTLAWKGDKVGMLHHRCYRDKATEQYLLTGRSGIEMVNWDKGWLGNNSWIRGTCQYGIMPANGLLYAPPNACACFSEVKLQGFFAAAPQRPLTQPSPQGGEGRVRGMPFTAEPALEKGPRYGKAAVTEKPAPGDWPAYRHDATRSGAVTAALPESVKKRWSASLKGILTQPITAGPCVYVASTDEHTVYALNADDGKTLWSHTAGGRIDSSPTFCCGFLLFGAADGFVTCLDAGDGGLVWRFRAAPKDLRVVSFGQLESVWPLHGSVLVQNNALYVTAGRSTYLDGGIVLYRLDPLSGKELSRNVVYNLDPETGKQTGVEPAGPFNMEGATSDILSGDGDSVFMKHLRFDASCKPAAADKPHLFSMTRLLGEEWFVRSYWLLGTHVGAGWANWANAAKTAPFGRILCFNKERVWGYGRKTISSGPTGHKADAYHLFCKMRPAATAEPVEEPARKAGRKKDAKEQAVPAPTEIWSVESSPIVRAMVLASDKLAIAGPPDVGQKDPKLLAYLNEAEALAAFNGEQGALLQVLSAADGKKLSEQRLSAMPVFDGMSVANGRLYISLKDGTVECWGE